MKNLHTNLDDVEKEVHFTADIKRKQNICKNFDVVDEEAHRKAAKERMENLH